VTMILTGCLNKRFNFRKNLPIDSYPTQRLSQSLPFQRLKIVELFLNKASQSCFKSGKIKNYMESVKREMADVERKAF